MKRLLTVIGLLCCTAATVAVWQPWRHTAVAPQDLLARKHLAGTKVSYSRSGYFTFEESVRCVLATFHGDGTAVLRLDDREPITTRIAPERYRGLLQTMAKNDFSNIAVKRRWGLYVNDFGSAKIVLETDRRQAVVYADGKHYVDVPDRLDAVVEEIFSFEKEFGESFDYGPVAISGTRDYSEIAIALAIATVIVLVVAGSLWIQLVRKHRSATTVS